jgi:membrane-bound lytic murein transglycosylase D
MKAMNPHLLKGCTPPDRDTYEVRIPAAGYEGFADRLAKVKDSQASQYFRHRVKTGDSLSAIASRYGTTVEEIVRFNGLRNSNRIVVGDQLMIPGLSAPQEPESPASAPIEVVEKSSPSSSIHVVRKGENLWSIAQAYGLSPESLASANGIKKSKTLYPGDKLKVPGRGVVQQEKQKVSVKVYKVKEGDTIWGIAQAGNTSIQKIQEANNLGPNDLLMPGDILKIPVSSTK